MSDDRWVSRLFELWLIFNTIDVPGRGQYSRNRSNNFQDLMAATVFQITAITGDGICAAITHAALTRKMGEGDNKILQCEGSDGVIGDFNYMVHGAAMSRTQEGEKLQCP